MGQTWDNNQGFITNLDRGAGELQLCLKGKENPPKTLVLQIIKAMDS